MTKDKAISLIVPNTILIGNFPIFNPLTLEALPMCMPIHLVSDCVSCSIDKPEITKNIRKIFLPCDNGYLLLWEEETKWKITNNMNFH